MQRVFTIMKNQLISKLIFLSITLFCWSETKISAQVLVVTDKSDAHANRIRSAINSNREIVNYIEYTLASRGLPKHLRNLSLLESGFYNGSVSSAGAVGIWQIMPGHASDNGLSLEDRADVYRSTQVAANSLTKLYNKYKNWITVLAAYNCGEGNIAKAMAKAGSTNYEDYYIYLPNETINSIRKYINACYVTGELDELLQNNRGKASPKIKAVKDKKPVQYQEVNDYSDPSLLPTPINSAYDLEVLASFLNVDLSDINKWNPDIARKLREDSEVTLLLPAEEMAIFQANKNKILKLSLIK